jgi:hypothetical protein
VNSTIVLPLLLVSGAAAIAGPGLSQGPASTPYAGLETREIKALSAQQIDAYHSGSGMGLALAAELNRHPGPKHVLEMAGDLQLTENQIERTRRVFSEMEASAVELGIQIVELEGKLDEGFATATLSEDELAEIVGSIAIKQGNLRTAHLRAHLEMVRILSSEQIDRYQSLRGYDQGIDGSGHNPEQHQMEKHGDHQK